jgi:hypothetical protein
MFFLLRRQISSLVLNKILGDGMSGDNSIRKFMKRKGELKRVLNYDLSSDLCLMSWKHFMSQREDACCGAEHERRANATRAKQRSPLFGIM